MVAARKIRPLLLLLALATGGGCDVVLLRLLPPMITNAPQQVVITRAVPYAEHDGKSLLFDLYRPANVSEPTPLVIVIFGGSWRSGDREQLMEFAYDLAANGYAAAAIDYRLADGDTVFPAPVADILTAVEFFREHADAMGVDPNRFGTFGASAGAHLAMLAGFADGVGSFDPQLPAGQPSGISVVINLFGPTDLTVDPTPQQQSQVSIVENFLGKPLAQAAQLRLMASPINHVRFDGPAVFTVHGDADETVPVSQARSLAAAMTAAGQTHEYLEVPGMAHVIGAVWISPEAQSYRTALFDFLAEHL